VVEGVSTRRKERARAKGRYRHARGGPALRRKEAANLSIPSSGSGTTLQKMSSLANIVSRVAEIILQNLG
jgi:hypothetical protein